MKAAALIEVLKPMMRPGEDIEEIVSKIMTAEAKVCVRITYETIAHLFL